MTQKKIWHLISNRWNSAITEYALSSARALEKRGFKSIFTAIQNSPADRRAKGIGLETLPVLNFAFGELSHLKELSRNIGSDHVLLYGGPETFLSKFLGNRKYIRFFGQDLNANLLRAPFLFSLSYSHVCKFITPNEIIASQIKQLGSSKLTRRILLGLEASSVLRNSLERVQLIVLGRLDPVKGHETILRIFSKMLKAWPYTHSKPVLHIIGEDANLSAKQFSGRVEELNLSSDVLITNERVPDIHSVLKDACMGIIPSLGSEHICRVAEEFLLVGTPILVSGAGATEEVLFPGAGESYRGHSEELAAQQLLQCVLKARIESNSERESRASKARVLFSLETMGKNLEDFIFG